MQALVADLNNNMLLIGVLAAWKTALHHAVDTCSRSDDAFYSLLPDMPPRENELLHKLCTKARSLRLVFPAK